MEGMSDHFVRARDKLRFVEETRRQLEKGRMRAVISQEFDDNPLVKLAVIGVVNFKLHNALEQRDTQTVFDCS